MYSSSLILQHGKGRSEAETNRIGQILAFHVSFFFGCLPFHQKYASSVTTVCSQLSATINMQDMSITLLVFDQQIIFENTSFRGHPIQCLSFITTIPEYMSDFPQTKICCKMGKLQFCNRCHCLPCLKIFMHII